MLRMTRKRLLVSMFVLLAVLAAGPVLAGGWAVITLDNLPGEIHAGESVHLSFMVRQHGQTPVHFLGGSDIPVEPVVSGTNVKTGETIEITAVADKSEVGRFYADIVFPSEGEWSWTIAPNPLAGTTEFAPLAILPAVKAPAANLQTTSSTAVEAAAPAAPAASSPDLTPLLRGAAVLLLAAGALTAFLAARRKQPRTAVVEAGD